MAHCAQLDENNKVVRVIVTNDSYGDKSCEDWCAETFGGVWKKTSYNTRGGIHYSPITGEPDDGAPLRKNYAGEGFTYDEGRDAFIPPKPFASWILNEDSCLWGPPVAYPDVKPDDGKFYAWDESSNNWKEQTI